jgi:RNA recognition motif-containing protein
MFSTQGKVCCVAAASKRNIIGQRRIVKETEVRMQGSKLYVGNLGYAVNKQELEDLFAGYGQVREIRIIEGKGFGFVEMSNSSEAEAAKEALDGSDFKGLTLKVDEARPPRKKQGGRAPRRGGPRRDFRRY